jgi:hypothetical protein
LLVSPPRHTLPRPVHVDHGGSVASRNSDQRALQKRLGAAPRGWHGACSALIAMTRILMDSRVFGAAASPPDCFPLNGIDGSTGAYLTPSLTAAQIATLAQGGRLDVAELRELEDKARAGASIDTPFPMIEGADAGDLAQAGWAVVFPAAARGSAEARRQAEIREALAPLLALRRQQAGRVREQRYREYMDTGSDGDGLGYRPGETKQQYLARLGAGPGPVNPDKVPYYLLLVASPAEIPYRIQYQLDVQYAVGRLYFDTVDEYAAYARSVVDVETGGVTRPPRATFFGVANPDDTATQLSLAYLVEPLASAAADRLAGRDVAVERVLGEQATRARLADIYRDAPAFLFSACHGMGFPAGDARQLALQGALLCQDWGGPGSRLERGHYFGGEDLDPRSDLRGMIAMCFACFGLGTPGHEDFTRRGLSPGPGQDQAQARSIAPHDFVARLPQRMLATPGGGALAVIGHVDRAWSSSFLWIDARGQRQTQAHLDVFESTVAGILDGKRVGHALEHFNLRHAELSSDLSARIEEMQHYDVELDENEIAQLWVFRNDARNYALLGDPAVRLPGRDRG